MADKRELSFWGWGYADRFPSAEERRNLRDLVAGMLGFTDLPVLDPPRLEDARLPPPRVKPPEELAAFVTAGRRHRVTHAYGRAYPDVVRGFRGDFGAAPDLVARPATEAEVAATLRWASEAGVAVAPYGGGTSVVAGVEARSDADAAGHLGVVSLDTRGLDRVLEVDAASRAARIQAGATGPRIAEQLRPHGLQLRHYPQSYEFSTLGGWIATRAGGHYATVATHIDDLVESVRMVTPAGEVETLRVPASGAGPDPNHTMLGSEGILGVITEAWVRVQQRPEHKASATARFQDWDSAVAATREIAQSRLHPANCRLLDKREAMLNQVDLEGNHVLVLGFESPTVPVKKQCEQALQICRDHGATTPDAPKVRAPGTGAGGDGGRDDKAGRWRSAFLDAPYLQTTLVSLGVIADTFETCTTWRDFPKLHRTIVKRVRGAMKQACGAGFLSLRFTHVYPDGPAPYYTFIAPADVGRELEQWRVIKKAAGDALRECGATITHHHAVGRTHREWYDSERPELWAEGLRALKKVMDPAGVMNPGVLLD